MIAIWLATTALAGTTVGLELGMHSDLSDGADASTRMSGTTLAIPVSMSLSDRARFVVAPRLDAGGGRDQVSWNSGQAIDGETFRFSSDTHEANLLSLGLNTGAELDLTASGKARPWVGAGLGVASVSHHHAFGGEASPDTIPLVLGVDAGGNSADPRTQQWAWVSELRTGVRMEMSDPLALGVHIGYSTAFIGARALKDTDPELDARRDAYGWNALRFGLAAHLAL